MLIKVESCFERGNEFIPERWCSRPEMIRNKSAYAPFALGLPVSKIRKQTKANQTIPGRYNCIGKNLVLAEIRYVTALLASKYDVSFPPGEDGRSVEENTLDQFTANPGQLRVVFRARQKS